MRQAEHKERVRTANAEAQKQALKETLAQVTEALSDTIKELSVAKGSTEALRVEGARLREENGRVTTDSGDKIRSAETARQDLRDESEALKNQVDSTDLYIKRSLDKFGEDARSLDLQISKNNGTIQGQEVRLKELAEAEVTLAKRLDDMKRELFDTREALQALGSELVSAKEEWTKELSASLKDISDSRKELLRVNKLVEDEKGKIEMPLKSLKLEQEKLDLNKRDLDIYRARTITQFRKVFPGQQINV